MTGGLTEGSRDAVGRHGRPAVPYEDETTTMIVPGPLADPARDGADEAKPRVLLLGSDAHDRELASALNHLGAEVILLDGADAGEPSAVIERVRPDHVVPDGAGTPADREELRRLAADELGLPSAPFWFAGSIAELEAVAAHAGYPLLLKPAVRAPGERRALVTGPDDIAAAWQRVVGGSAARVLAETVVEVEFLVTLIAVAAAGPRAPVIEFCSPIGHREEPDGGLESWQPQQMSPAALDAAKSIAARIVKALGGRGVFGVELMISGDEVYFADVTAFPPESSWVTLRTQRLSAFELHARTILGLPADTMMLSPGAARVIASGGGRGRGIGALTEALGVPESDVRVFAPPARPDPGRPRRLGVALATAPDVATARDRAREVASRLGVPDSGE